MLKEDFYAHHKLLTASNNALGRLIQQMQTIVDHDGWIPAKHNDLLRTKVLNKVSQMRVLMVKSGEIIKQGKGYVKNSRLKDFDPLPDDSEEVQAIRAVWDSLEDELLVDALHAGFERVRDLGTIMQILSSWVTRRQAGAR